MCTDTLLRTILVSEGKFVAEQSVNSRCNLEIVHAIMSSLEEEEEEEEEFIQNRTRAGRNS